MAKREPPIVIINHKFDDALCCGAQHKAMTRLIDPSGHFRDRL